MVRVISRDVSIVEEDITLTGQSASNMYDNWSEEMADRIDNVHGDIEKKPAQGKKIRKKKIKEIDEVIEEDLEQLVPVMCLARKS